MRPLLRRSLLALCAVPLTAGAVEAVLLLAGFAHAPAPGALDREFAEGRIDGYRVHARDARQLWTPIPGARLPWSGDVLGPAGFRGPVPAPDRRAGVARIAALGDSAALGRGVGAAECFVAVAARELGARAIPCEALNAGVVGFSVVQGLERYERDLRPWKPDVVIAAFGGFEEHQPALGWPDAELIASGAGDPAAAGGVLARLARDSKLGQLLAWLRGGCSAAPTAPGAEGPALGGLPDPAGDPRWNGPRRVSVDAFGAALRELARRVRADGGRLVLVDVPCRPAVSRAAPVLEAYSKRAADVAHELGLERVDARALFAAAVAEGATYQELFCGPAEPAQLGHARIGRELALRIAALLGPR